MWVESSWAILSLFSGGLISDLQRLLPLDSGSDLYLVKYPDVPASLLYYVRPFQPADEEAVYSLAADAYERTIDAPMGEFSSGPTGLVQFHFKYPYN